MSVGSLGKPFDSRSLVAAGYVILIVGALFPLIDFVAAVSPIRLGDVRWRFGAGGLISTYANATLIDLFLLAALSAWARHRGALIVISAIAGVALLLLLGTTAMFTLDTLQVRSQVTGETMSQFDFGAAQAFLKLGMLIVGSALLSVGSMRVARRNRVGDVAGARSDATVVVGRSPAGTAGPSRVADSR